MLRLASVALFVLGTGCQPTCPPLAATSRFEGEGFLVAQDPTHTAAVFFPACSLNPQHYMQSWRPQNLGDGVTVGLYNFAHTLALLAPPHHFALLTPPDTLGYPFDGVFIAPVRMRYSRLHHDAPPVRDTLDLKLKEGNLTKSYMRASQEVETIEFLPYQP